MVGNVSSFFFANGKFFSDVIENLSMRRASHVKTTDHVLICVK